MAVQPGYILFLDANTLRLLVATAFVVLVAVLVGVGNAIDREE
jgi:hypothetical protein